MTTLALTVSLLAFARLPQAATAAIERTGTHFRIVSHLAQERLADEALQAAEAAWPLALDALDLKDKKFAELLVVHLYPDAASYAAAEQPLTGGAFKASLSFSHFATRSAHVALQPPCTEETVRALGLPLLTGYLVAHEASHLVSYAFLPNALSYPEWFAEGMAQHVGLQALVGLARARAGGAEPLAAQSALRCQELFAADKLPRAADILAMEIGDLEFYPRYAVNHEFYEFLLAEHPKDLQKTVAAIKKVGGGEGYRAGLSSEIGKLWKPKEQEKLQEGFVSFVRELAPEWDEVLRSLETHGTGFVQRAGELNAMAFRTTPIESLPFKAAGVLRFVSATSTDQLNFLFGKGPRGFFSVAFSLGRSVTLFYCTTGQKEDWKILGTAPGQSLRLGLDIPFRVEVSPEELVVFVSDKETLRAPLGGKSPLGRWGLGTQAGSTGEWKSIAVKAGP